MMQYGVLGSLEVLDRGQEIPLGGAKQRAVLAILLLHAREVVSVDRLVDELWGDRPPDTATKTVQVYISRLRKTLGNDQLLTRGPGYVLELDPEQLDAHRFERLAADGRSALARGDARAASDLFRQALELWRGPALADFTYDGFAQTEIARLEELRLGALEGRFDAELADGRHAALVPELETLVRDHPSRERLREQLMLALYRSGRQREALDSYQDARRELAEELGLEPGRELQDLQQAILAQDPALDPPAHETVLETLHRGRRGGLLVVVGAALLLLVAVAAVVAGGDEEPEPAQVPGNSVAVVDPGSNRVTASIPTGVRPDDVAAGAGFIWVANAADDTVTQIAPRRREVVSTTSPRISVAGLAADAQGVWVGDSRRLMRLDPDFPSEARSVSLAPEPILHEVVEKNPIATGYGSVWTGRAYGAVARVDARTFEVLADSSVGNSPSAIATGGGAVWIADDDDNTVTRMDPSGESAVLGTITVGQGPSAVAVGEGAVWVANTGEDTVSRIDPRTATVSQTIPVGRRPTGVAVGDGAVWVANSLSGTLHRIDPETNQVEATVDVGEAPQKVTVASGHVWVTVAPEARADPAPSNAPGGVARILVASDPGPVDPLVDFDLQRQMATCARLYNYRDRPFPEGAKLRPEVARGQPTVSPDGLTHTFEIRSGFRFSPPSNDPVTAAAFERALQRAKKTGAFGSELLLDVTDVRARGNELTLRLAEPVPNLPSRLAAPYFCAIPPNTPLDKPGIDGLPTAGPYYVVSHERDRSLVLRRNPNYHGPRPHRLAEIRYRFGVPPERAVAAIEAGRADLMALHPPGEPGVSAAMSRRLERLYGPSSEAARAGQQQLFTQPAPNLYYFAFNTRRGPFTSSRMRQAVNFAIDRRALAEQTGGGEVGRPTDQHIPPGLPGFEDAAIYPLGGPDLNAARRLAGKGRRRAVLYTCDLPGCSRHGQILRSNLQAIGIDLEVRQFPLPEFFERLGRPGEPFDITWANWFFDYADPFSYINIQFSDEGLANYGAFDDSPWQERMDAVARLSGEERLRSYAELDRELAAEAAPAAPFASGSSTYLLSARMGCQVLHPIYGLDLAALCIREGEGRAEKTGE